MGIITEAGGQSRFYAVTTRFEGITFLADSSSIYHPNDPINQEAIIQSFHHWPHINLNDAEALDLKSLRTSWPHGEPFPGNGRGASILSFKPEAGFHAGDKFLAYISNHSSDLFLASLTNPGPRMTKVPISGHNRPPSRTVFSTDNKFTLDNDVSCLASLRFLKEDETTALDCNLKRVQEDTILFVPLHSELPTQVKPSLGIDGGFLLRGNQDTEAIFFTYSNQHRKFYVFYGRNHTPFEVTFDDFLICPYGLPTKLSEAN